jgi:ethanolamine utilization protein EutJ
MVYTADEATGGTHMTLVVAGNKRIPYNEAELYKCDAKNASEVIALIIPVINKMASIIKKHIYGYNPGSLILVGGTCKIPGMESIIGQETGIPTYKPSNPLLVTPAGIATHCT